MRSIKKCTLKLEGNLKRQSHVSGMPRKLRKRKWLNKSGNKEMFSLFPENKEKKN